MSHDSKDTPLQTTALFSLDLERSIASSQEPISQLQKRWPRDVELGIEAEASIYHGYPYLFLGAFPGLIPEDIESLALACRLFADSLFVADDIMDEDPTDRERAANVLRVEAMQFEAYRLLHRLFPPEARFWDRLQTYLAVYAKACLDEKFFSSPRNGWGELTEAAALSIARGKSSLAKFAVAGLAELAGDDGPLEPLTRALDRYYVARQMVDDLTDWREDLRRGVPSLLLGRLSAVEFPSQPKEELTRQIDRTTQAIYFGGHGRYVLRLGLRTLERAVELSAPYPDLPWQRVLGKLGGHFEKLMQDLDRLTGSEPNHLRRTVQLRVPAAEGPWQETAWEALTAVLDRWRPAAQGVVRQKEGEEETVRWHRAAPGGDLILRTLVAESLCEADQVLGGQLEELLQGEVEYLLYRVTQAGGWGLSAVFPGLPGDADHLARGIHLLLHTGHREEVLQRCEEPLAALLGEAEQRADGSLPLWIPGAGDPEARPPSGEPDASVTARLLHALWLYDCERFHEVVDAGAFWLEARQLPDGTWSSPAYRGPYEPVAAAVGFFAAARSESASLGRAVAFLRRSQCADGAWGLEDQPADPLSTALALLALAECWPAAGEPDDLDRAHRGRERLERFRREDAAVKSGSVLTAAFALRAALRWQRFDTGATKRQPGVEREVPEARESEELQEVGVTS